MASHRLPGKVLADVGGRPMLWHAVHRAGQAARLDGVLVATSVNPADDEVEAFCVANRIDVHRGSEEDVLDRFYQAASAHRATSVVRLTADCPLLDPDVIDRVVADFQTGGADYVSNTVERSYPDGLDVEVCSFQTLERAWREAEWASEREHVTPYVWKHPDRFTIRQVVQAEDLSSLRWTVDDPRDLELVRSIYGLLGPDACRMSDVLDVLRRNPELARLNAGIGVNEGYRRAVAHDRQEPRHARPVEGKP